MQNRGAVHLGHSFVWSRLHSLRRYQNLGVVGVAPRQQPARERRQHLLGGAVQVERRERVGARRAVVEERDGRAALGDGAHEAERAVHLDRAADDDELVGARAAARRVVVRLRRGLRRGALVLAAMSREPRRSETQMCDVVMTILELP